MWKIKEDDYWKDGAIEVLEDRVPVLIKRTGTYPVAVSDDGRTTENGKGYTPHIEISISGGSGGGTKFYSGVTVLAVGRWQRNGTRRQMIVFSKQSYDRNMEKATPERFIQLGKSYIDQAIDLLGKMDELYEAAKEFVERAYRYSGPFFRDEYEAICAACEVDALPDDEIFSSYAVKYGDFQFPEYSAEHIAKMYLAGQRNLQLEKEAKEIREKQRAAAADEFMSVKREGQLWEPCEQCGKEPVYLPLHLCDNCWPK